MNVTDAIQPFSMVARAFAATRMPRLFTASKAKQRVAHARQHQGSHREHDHPGSRHHFLHSHRHSLAPSLSSIRSTYVPHEGQEQKPNLGPSIGIRGLFEGEAEPALQVR
jgi:hypothetical protein